MRVGSLFSGTGGLDMAVEEVLGATTAWVSDIDKGACKILAHRYPTTPNLGDITSVDWASVEPVDIITGGSPCQDLSHAGKRQGMSEGTRSNLWVAMREAIAQLRPRYVVWENVRGAYSACADSDLGCCPRCLDESYPGGHAPLLRALGRVLGDLSDLRYDCRWYGIRAADVGAPHGRFRVFVVATNANGQGRGSLGGQHPIGRDLDRRDSADGPRSETQPTSLVADAVDLRHERGRRARDGWAGPANGGLLPTPRATDGTKGGPNQRGSSGDLMLPSAVASLLPTPTTRDHKDHMIRREPHRPDDVDTLSRALTVTLLHEKSLAIEAQRLLPTPIATDSHDMGHDGHLHWEVKRATGAHLGTAPGEEWGDYAAAIARWEHVLGRPAPAPTMTSTKGNPQLSPAFVEWMMGLPAGWVTDVPGITRNEALKALGNGVVVAQAAAALRAMLAWEMAAS